MTIAKAIDLGRVGLSKSLMTNFCQRKGYYSETVRDQSGRRIRTAMPEKVHFGSAIDSAHAYIVGQLREGRDWNISAALAAGIARVSDTTDWSEPVDWDRFGSDVETAIKLFRSQPDGLKRLMPDIQGIRIQGDDGRSLQSGDVIGTPDYLFADGSVLDVKTTGKRYNPDKFVRSPEMGVYALLGTAESGGIIPPRLIYQVYVRNMSPYWHWLEVPGTYAHVALGKLHAAHWRKAIAAGDPELMAVDIWACGDCPFSVPIPEVGFDGCAVGMAVREAAAA